MEKQMPTAEDVFALRQNLFNVCLRFTQLMEDPWSEAEDLCSQTIVQMVSKLDEFRGDSSLYTWGYRITVNICKNHLESCSTRRKKESFSIDDCGEGQTCREPTDDSRRTDPQTLLEAKFNRQSAQKMVAEALEKMAVAKPNYVALVKARYIEGLSYAEIAEQFNLTISQVRMGLYHGKVRLKGYLAQAKRNGEL